MTSPSTLFSHANSVQVTCRNTSSVAASVGRKDPNTRQESIPGNYLPGLRGIENEAETYFKNDFVWLGY